MNLFKFLLSTVILLPALSQAANYGTAKCESEKGGVVLLIKKLGYDKLGSIYQATIYKNDRLIRNSVLHGSGNGAFGLYTPRKPGVGDQTGWSFSYFENNLGVISSHTYMHSLERELSIDGTQVICKQSLPLKSWETH